MLEFQRILLRGHYQPPSIATPMEGDILFRFFYFYQWRVVRCGLKERPRKV